MTPKHRDRARQLFDEAIDLDGDDLAALVAQAKVSEPPEVVDHFKQLLVDHQAAEQAGFLGSPAAPTSSDDDNATVSEERSSPSDTIEFISGESLSTRREASDRPGPLLADDYEILDEIGRGGMGTVYRAYQLSLRRHVAVKIIPTNLIRSPEESARFYIEAEAAAKLEHPGIVQVQDVGERNGVHYYTMALVTGGSLADYVGKEKRFTRQRAAEVMEAVSRAVQYAHDRAVIHRDIKPANILLDREGQPRLTDFGLAKLVNDDDHLTLTGQVMGTPSYMAPEQAEGDSRAISNRTDVYSLGATLYALLAGKAPFSGETLFSTLQQVQKSAPPPLPSAVPLDLRTICNKCLEKIPANRYASASDLADDLRNYLDGFPIAARRVGRIQRAIGWARRNPTDATLLGGIAAALLIGLLVSNYFRLQSNHHANLAQKHAEEAEQNLAKANFNAQELQKAIRDTYLYASNDLLGDAPGMEKARRVLLETARQYYETQLEMEQLSPDKVADVRANLGQVQAALGDNESARVNYDEAIGLYETQLQATPIATDADVHWSTVKSLAQVHREYANLAQLEMTLARNQHDVGAFGQSVELFANHAQQCADLRQSAAAALPDDCDLQRVSANGKMNLAIARIEQYGLSKDKSLLAEAEELIGDAQTRRAAIKDRHPQPAKVAFDLAKGHQSIAEIHLIRAATNGEQEQRKPLLAALESQIKCVNLLSAIPVAAQSRETNDYLATSLHHLGETYDKLGAKTKARDSFEAVLKIRELLLLNNPAVSEYRIGVARAHYNLSDLLKKEDESASFLHFRRCQEVLAQGPQVEPTDAEPVVLLTNFTKAYTDELLKGSLRDDAVAHIRYGYQLLEQLPEVSRELDYVSKARSDLKQMLQGIEDASQDESV